jgi:hypothetical protein
VLPVQDCEVAGLPQLLLATVAPSERWQLTLRDCVPEPQLFEQVLHPPMFAVYVQVR